jgi:hypothetical protein
MKDTERSAIRAATEISRDLGLGLSNGELQALTEWLDGRGPEAGAREVCAGGPTAVREVVGRARAA